MIEDRDDQLSCEVRVARARTGDESLNFHQDAVSTTHELATSAALVALCQGGNAADAVAVAQFVLNVVQPQSTGIGGGCMGLIYSAEQERVLALDGREEAPRASSPRMFCQDS